MKTAIVIGHNAVAQGAYSPHLKESEFPFNDAVSKLIGDGNVRTFRRLHTSRGYTAEIMAVYGEVDDWGADVSVELHFNAYPGATGTETLSSGTSGSMNAARIFQSEMVAELGLPDRGIKIRRTGRGSQSLWAGQAPAILTEPFFGSSKDDCKGMTAERLADIYSSAISKL